MNKVDNTLHFIFIIQEECIDVVKMIETLRENGCVIFHIVLTKNENDVHIRQFNDDLKKLPQ